MKMSWPQKRLQQHDLMALKHMVRLKDRVSHHCIITLRSGLLQKCTELSVIAMVLSDRIWEKPLHLGHITIAFNPFRPYLLSTLLLMANTTNRFKTLLVLTYHNQMKTEHQQLYIMLQFRGLLSSQKNSFVAPRSILFCFFIEHDKKTFFTCSKQNSKSEDCIGY